MNVKYNLTCDTVTPTILKSAPSNKGKNMSNFKKPTMVRIQNSLSFDMLKIKAGKFQMGSNDFDDEKPVHKVTIDYDFELGKYPVTIAEYMHFAKEHEEHLPHWKDKDAPDYYEGQNYDDNAPIIGVSWHDAVAFCEWLNEKQEEYVYRLPTEAEWEYACRAESTTKWCFGDNERELDNYAWYRENSENTTHIVGEKLPNKWGLYDIHGNVWEWCLDDYVDNYKSTPRDGSVMMDENSGSKVLRGGSWNDDVNNTRSAYRSRSYPTDRNYDVGFRLLRTLV